MKLVSNHSSRSIKSKTTLVFAGGCVVQIVETDEKVDTGSRRMLREVIAHGFSEDIRNRLNTVVQSMDMHSDASAYEEAVLKEVTDD